MNEEHQRALALAAMELYLKRERARRRRLLLLSLGLYAIVLAFAEVRRRVVIWHRRIEEWEEWEDWDAHSISFDAKPLGFWYRLVFFAVVILASVLATLRITLHVAVPRDVELFTISLGLAMSIVGLYRSFRP